MIWLVVGFILGASPALFIGWYGREILTLLRKKEEKAEPYVTNPYIASKPYKSEDTIIQPKTPQQLQNESYERIKRGDV